MNNRQEQICTNCVMDTTDSKITFDEHGVCDNCMEKHFPDVIEVWNKKDFFEDGQKRFLES